MKNVKMLFFTKDERDSLEKTIKDQLYQDLTNKDGDQQSKYKGITAHWCKWPLSVAGWYIVESKQSKLFAEEYGEAIEAANIETKEEAPTTKVPKAKKADRGSLLQEYGRLTGKAKKLAKDKARIKVIEAELIS